MHARVLLPDAAADVHAYGCGAAQPQVEQHQVGYLLLHKRPEFLLGHGRAYHFGVGYLVAENFFRPLQLQLGVFHDNHFVFHFFFH